MLQRHQGGHRGIHSFPGRPAGAAGEWLFISCPAPQALLGEDSSCYAGAVALQVLLQAAGKARCTLTDKPSGTNRHRLHMSCLTPPLCLTHPQGIRVNGVAAGPVGGMGQRCAAVCPAVVPTRLRVLHAATWSLLRRPCCAPLTSQG